jgi:hypothetical protein
MNAALSWIIGHRPINEPTVVTIHTNIQILFFFSITTFHNFHLFLPHELSVRHISIKLPHPAKQSIAYFSPPGCKGNRKVVRNETKEGFGNTQERTCMALRSRDVMPCLLVSKQKPLKPAPWCAGYIVGEEARPRRDLLFSCLSSLLLYTKPTRIFIERKVHIAKERNVCRRSFSVVAIAIAIVVVVMCAAVLLWGQRALCDKIDCAFACLQSYLVLGVMVLIALLEGLECMLMWLFAM